MEAEGFILVSGKKSRTENLGGMESGESTIELPEESNLNEGNFMHQFMQEKYSEVGNLQSYLLGELQLIENNKIKHLQVKQLVRGKILPTLQQAKLTLEGVKTLFQPLFLLTTNYIEAVHLKCQDLLRQKQHRSNQLKKEVQKLTKQLKTLKAELTLQQLITKPTNCNPVVPNIAEEQQKNSEICLFNRYRRPEKHEPIREVSEVRLNPSKNRLKNNPYLIQEINCPEKEEISSSSSSLQQTVGVSRSRTPRRVELKISSNQSDVSVLQSKKVNISYRCQKSPTFDHLSPSKSKQKRRYYPSVTPKKESGLPPPATRKDYIKQKIQNLKLKAESENRKPSLRD